MSENVLSPAIESRYRMLRRLIVWFAPSAVLAVCAGALMGRVGVWIGDADQVGAVLLVMTAVCAVAGIFWHRARVLLTMLVTAAFGGRAFGFLLVGADGFTWLNRLGSALIWGGLTVLSLVTISQWDTIVAFREERRAAGVE